MEKIVSHIRPSHMDDFIGLFLLKNFYPSAKIEYINFNDPILEEYKNNDKICLIDVGRNYNENLLNLDHHHDPNLECSALLVIKYLDKDFYNNYKDFQVLKYTNHLDLFGPKDLVFNYPLIYNWKRKIITFCDIEKHYKQLTETFLFALSKYADNYDEFIQLFVDLNEDIYQELKPLEKELVHNYNMTLAEAQLYYYNNCTILVSNKTLSPFHYKTMYKFNIDIIIEKARGNENQTAIFRKDIDKHNFDNLEKFGNIVFKHNSKFLYVIDANLDNLPLQKVFEAIV